MRRHATWVLVLVGLEACSGSPGIDGGTGGGAGGGSATGGGGGSTAPLTEREYCDGRVDALCQVQVACGTYEALAGCRDAYDAQRLEYALDDCSVGRAATADGRQRFDGAAAASCLGGLSASTCRTPATCGAVFTPLVAQGGACFDDRECVMGTACQTTLTCPGTCQPRVGADGVLAPGERCLEGLGTQYTFPTDGGFQVEYRCKAPAPAGQPCSLDFAFSCMTGLACSPATSTCVSARAAGEPCEYRDGGAFGGGWVNGCEGGLFCQPSPTGGAPRCGALAAVGAPCGTCRLDLRCVRDGGEVGTCALKGTAGEACALPQDCAFGFFCQPSGTAPLGPGTCQPRQATGALCRSSLDCTPGLDCVQGPASDGGLFPESRCAARDGGSASSCVDRSP